MATIKINNIESLSSPESYTITPDDRQEIVQLINNNVVQDFGHIESGDKVSFSVNFWKSDFDKIKQYWDKRILVNFEDVAGNVFKDCRVVIKNYSYKKYFESSTITTNLEIWRI